MAARRLSLSGLRRSLSFDRRRGSAKAKAQARRKRFSTHELQLSQSFSSRAATNSLTANSEQFWQTQPAKFQLAV